MKNLFLVLLPMFAVTACGVAPSDGLGIDSISPSSGLSAGCHLAAQTATTDPAQCVSAGKVPVYSNRFSATCGASSVVSGADALADNASGAGTPPSPSDPLPSAMAVSCGEPSCAAGEVGVVDPTPGIAQDPATAGAVRCAAAPPSCPDGQSPQFVFSSSTWDCTDCSVVITYGGAYGNYSRCASAPTISCPSGQVPTWVYEDEQWECKPTCDNGQYDQHAVNGSTVCVPC